MQKESSPQPSTEVTESDAAQATADIVMPSSGGMIDQVNNTMVIAVNYSGSNYCGTQKDSTIVHASTAGAQIAYDYSLKWSWKMTCGALNTPQKFDLNFTGTSNYNGMYFTSADNATGSLSLTGLETTANNYTYNQTYTRTGSRTFKNNNTSKTFTGTIVITANNIVINKSTRKISSGSGTVTITGVAPSGSSFGYNGTITFNGDNTASLILNSGVSYKIQW